MSDTEQMWIDQSRYDLDTARAMLASGRYLYVMFCCQQASEKTLKAVIVRKTGALPPRIHNLLRLAEAAGLDPEQETARFLGELSAYYIQTRYPEEVSAGGQAIGEGLAREVLSKTEQFAAWVLSTGK
ncbi:MAG: HEPN domain-containing protein [Phycisphaerae bacterium]|nr:HEPN domain-containing protein [Phycisphaerae bacterium]